LQWYYQSPLGLFHWFRFFLLLANLSEWQAEVMSASGDDVIYCVLQIAINSKDHVIASKITTRARTYGGGEPIILETVTEDGVRKIRGRGGWLAVLRVGSEPKAVMDWADIGAELPMFGIDGGVGLIPSGIRESSSFSNGGIRLGDDGKGVCMLLVSGSFRLSDDRPIVAVRNSQSEGPRRQRRRQEPKK
jgi:hypothetical protein